VAWNAKHVDEPALLKPEWLVTNGLGGYASGTIAGPVTRRYHGLLVAALPTPLGRMVLLSHLWERVRLPDRTVVVLTAEDRAGALELAGARNLLEFRLEDGLPVWRYDLGGIELEQRVLMPHGQNTVYVRYALAGNHGPLRLTLRPSTPFRSHHAPVSEPLPGPLIVTATADRYDVACGESLPTLRFALQADGAAFTVDEQALPQVTYRIEAGRRYEAVGDLRSAGYLADRPLRGRVASRLSAGPRDRVPDARRI
jgi:glycogen debranching enzyme